MEKYLNKLAEKRICEKSKNEDGITWEGFSEPILVATAMKKAKMDTWLFIDSGYGYNVWLEPVRTSTIISTAYDGIIYKIEYDYDHQTLLEVCKLRSHKTDIIHQVRFGDRTLLNDDRH